MGLDFQKSQRKDITSWKVQLGGQLPLKTEAAKKLKVCAGVACLEPHKRAIFHELALIPFVGPQKECVRNIFIYRSKPVDGHGVALGEAARARRCARPAAQPRQHAGTQRSRAAAVAGAGPMQSTVHGVVRADLQHRRPRHPQKRVGHDRAGQVDGGLRPLGQREDNLAEHFGWPAKHQRRAPCPCQFLPKDVGCILCFGCYSEKCRTRKSGPKVRAGRWWAR